MFSSPHQLFGAGSVLVSLIAFVPYLWGIYRKQVRPHLIGWMIWTLLTAVIFWAQLQSGGGFGAWTTATISFTCLIAFVCSFFYGDKSITRFDIICLGLSIVAIGLWLICKTPLYSVILLTFVEYLGMGAMTKKTYLDPYSENLTYFILCIIKYTFAAMTLDSWSWITAFYPVAIVVQALAFSLMIIYRRTVLRTIKPPSLY